MPQIKLNGNTYGGNIYDTQPIGEVIQSASDKNPAGYLPCDGRSVLRSEYPDLFNKIGTTYGAEDDEHFNLPNESDVTEVSGNVQSTSEFDTGKVDVDGNKIYGKFFIIDGIFSMTAGSSFQVLSDTGILATSVVGITGIVTNAQGNVWCSQAIYYIAIRSLYVIQHISTFTDQRIIFRCLIEYVK